MLPGFFHFLAFFRFLLNPLIFKYSTYLYKNSNGSDILKTLEAGTVVMIYKTSNGLSRISSMNNARENLGYVEAGAVERLT